MKIMKGRLQGARFVRANAFGGEMKNPLAIVVHDTAGRLDKFSSVKWFASLQCKTSAHFTIERDGTITQQVPTDRKAFHAGASKWGGRSMCNGFTIGIEIVNPGKLDKEGKAWFGKATDLPLVKKSTKEHGDGYWLPYTPEQIDAVKKLCRAIVEANADCNEIVTHWMISPKRKIDTNPLFPLDEVRAYALGESNDEDEADQLPPPEVVAASVKPAKRFTIPAADGPVSPSVKDLAPVSRKVSALKRVQAFFHSIWVSVAGFLTLENVGVAKGFVDDVKGMVSDLALPLGIVGVVGGLFFVRYLLQKIGDDYESGRYTPSGAEG